MRAHRSRSVDDWWFIRWIHRRESCRNFIRHNIHKRSKSKVKMFVSKMYFRWSALGNGELEIVFLLNQADHILVFNHGDFFLVNKGNNFSLTGLDEAAGVEGVEIESIMCAEQYDPVYIFLAKDKIIRIGFYPDTYGDLTQRFTVINSNDSRINALQQTKLKKMHIFDLRYNGGAAE